MLYRFLKLYHAVCKASNSLLHFKLMNKKFSATLRSNLK